MQFICINLGGKSCRDELAGIKNNKHQEEEEEEGRKTKAEGEPCDFSRNALAVKTKLNYKTEKLDWFFFRLMLFFFPIQLVQVIVTHFEHEKAHRLTTLSATPTGRYGASYKTKRAARRRVDSADRKCVPDRGGGGGGGGRARAYRWRHTLALTWRSSQKRER